MKKVAPLILALALASVTQAAVALDLTAAAEKAAPAAKPAKKPAVKVVNKQAELESDVTALKAALADVGEEIGKLKHRVDMLSKPAPQPAVAAPAPEQVPVTEVPKQPSEPSIIDLAAEQAAKAAETVKGALTK